MFKKGLCMDSLLRIKASSNFEKHLQEFIQKGKSTGLPTERLTKIEWEKLNEELKTIGVQLVLRPHGNGVLYYWFAKYNQPTMNKTDSFNRGMTNAFNLLLSEIRNKYPNIPDAAIIEMIKTGGQDTGDIYKKLRYKQDGRYTGTSKQDFENAFIYALQSCGNRDELKSLPFIHNWNPREYENTSAFNMTIRRGFWPIGRNIKMTGNQDWTWFRRVVGNVLPPIKDLRNPNGFHISLNVNINDKILSALDDILMEDGGRYIQSYKFPKTSFYDDVVLRHDPITIYMHARNPEIERKIVRAVQPFVRSNDGLIGEMLGGGVSISPETSSTDMSVGEKVSMDIANLISQYKDRL